MREQQRPASQARRSEGGLGTSVAAANHDDIELLRELHRERQFYATVPRGTSVTLRAVRFTWNIPGYCIAAPGGRGTIARFYEGLRDFARPLRGAAAGAGNAAHDRRL